MDHYQIGPAGGNGGTPFEQYDVPADAHLSAIHIYSEWVLNALQIEYIRGNDVAGSISPVGGLGGEHHVFYLDPDEYLTGISGRAGWYIDSIRFHTNKRVSPTYGGVGGERDFSFEAKSGYEIGGFFGRSAWYIDALGITVRPRSVQSADETELMDEDAEGFESWLELAGEGEALPASVVVRRRSLASGEALEELEDTALAEAIAGMSTVAAEGTVDAAVYSQVSEDEDSGNTIAIVLAVASEMGAVETVGDDPQEVAVMVTDAIETDEEMVVLEEEAVENAIDMLLEEMEEEADEVEVTIYSGISQDETDDQLYGAVVAIATRLPAEPTPQTRAVTTEKKDKRPQQPGKDLQLIEGIGPKIAELLIANGIHDLTDLAAAPVEQIREILLAAGRRFRLADPGSWPEQAKLGAAGLWDALSELQARLKGGR